VNGSASSNEGLGGEGGQGGDGSSASGGQSSGGSSSSGGSNSGGSSSSGGSNGTGGSTSSGDLSCSEGVLELGTATELNTESYDDSYTTGCGAGDSPEAAFVWTAPSTNYYAFDSGGSGFDTVVAVLDGDCDGDELACSNVNGTSPQARAVTKLEKDQRVVVVLDGNLGESGDAQLNVTPVSCPSTDVSDQPLPATLSTVGGTNTHQGDCGGANAPEKAIRYVAKADGLYRFSVMSQDFSPALYVEQGVECGGTLLQCNDNVADGYPAEVTRWLAQGEAVTLIVDGGEGEFTLDAQKLEDPGACAALPQLENVTNVLLDDTAPHLLSTSCEWAGNQLLDDSLHPYPEHVYTFTVDLTTGSNCSIHVTSDADFQVSLLRGDHCNGPETFCEGALVDYERYFYKEDNGVYTLAIENTSAFGTPVTYSITTDC
jgi:hypothetical protein